MTPGRGDGTTIPSSVRRRSPLLAVAVLVALTAACTSDDPGETDATTAATVTTPSVSTVTDTSTVDDGTVAPTTAAGATSAPASRAPNEFPDALPVVIDTDANNELDDQHALAYALLRPDLFDLVAVTSNATRTGGSALAHAAEAERIIALTARTGTVPVAAGANGTFDEIAPSLGEPDHDGRAAVDTIIEAARADGDLVVIAVGKLTNVALALAKAPDIAPDLRVVWLGSNYPLGGNEYNLDNDPGALTYVLDDGVDAGVDFEIATVRPGDPTGTAAVQLTVDEATTRMPGLGPVIDPPIVGRTGRTHATFGDYSAELFRSSQPFGDPPRRSLFDLAGVAIVAEPGWAQPVEGPAPSFLDGAFVERPDRSETIVYWEQFDAEAIVGDLFTTLEAASDEP